MTWHSYLLCSLCVILCGRGAEDQLTPKPNSLKRPHLLIMVRTASWAPVRPNSRPHVGSERVTSETGQLLLHSHRLMI